MQTDIRGLSTHYIHLPGKKGPVLFLHGWNTPIEKYQPIFDLLQQLDYGVVAFDMPGVGGTDEPKKPLTVADYTAFTLELCQKLGVTTAIPFAHSHGGRIAFSMLTDPACPVRCHRAILMDSTGIRPPQTLEKRIRQWAYKLAKFLGTNKLTAPLFDDLYIQLRDKRSSADYKAASPVMRQTMSTVLRADFTDKMPSITAEVLLLWGEQDADTPLSRAETMEKLIPNAGIARILGAGHFPFVDNWPQVEAVLRAFL